MAVSLSRRAYITITIGTLLLSGAFLVLSLDYANTTGVFYTQRNMPVVVFTAELEALTSLAYSMPEDARIEYSGPHSCTWSQMENAFVCQGGLEIEGVGADVSFTKDEHMLSTPRSGCLYISFGTILDLAKRLGGGIKSKIIGQGDNLISKLSATIRNTRIAKGIGRVVGWFKSAKQRVGQWWQSQKARVWIRDRGTLSHQIARDYGIGVDDARRILTENLDISDDLAEGILRQSASDWAPVAVGDRANLGDLMMGASQDVSEETMEFLTRRVALDQAKREAAEAAFEGYWTSQLVPKARRQRLIEAFHRGTRAAVGYNTCRNNDLFWNFVDFLLGNQFLIQVDWDTTTGYFDFYAGKYGAVTVDFDDGFGNDIKAAKTYVVNGEDMCFLRSQLSYYGGGYETPTFDISDGRVVLSKSKNIFDTLCPEGSEYYPIDVGGIVEKMAEVKDGGEVSFNVYVTPGRSMAYEGGKLCEKKVARTETGERSGEFTIFCYDMSDLDFAFSIDLDDPLTTGVSEDELSVDYTIHEGLIFETGLGLEEIEEKGNTYWFKHGCVVDTGINFDIPLLTTGLLEPLGGSNPFQGLNNLLDWTIPLPCGSEEEKKGFFQSMYYKCVLNANHDGVRVDLTNLGCVPVVYMDWEDIHTDDFICGDGTYENEENCFNCPLDCPASASCTDYEFEDYLTDDASYCSECTVLCADTGYSVRGICEETAPGGDWYELPGPSCSTDSGSGTCFCELEVYVTTGY